jgi:predicted RNA binding protein YcfA (HicA-like mRNA interferase family)
LSRTDKLVDTMRRSPSGVRFGDVETLLGRMGFVLFNSRGSHRTYHHADGRLLTVVRPHGRRKTCHPQDIRKLLGVLGL